MKFAVCKPAVLNLFELISCLIGKLPPPPTFYKVKKEINNHRMTFINFCLQHNISLVIYLQNKIIINVISQVGLCMNIRLACHHANTCTQNGTNATGII